MAHTKDSFLNGSLFNTLWAMASQVLSSSDEIYFLGYGFPPTDIGNLFFFLNYKEKIKQIVVFNEESSPEFSRLKGIFGDEILLKQDAKDYLTANLEKWR